MLQQLGEALMVHSDFEAQLAPAALEALELLDQDSGSSIAICYPSSGHLLVLLHDQQVGKGSSWLHQRIHQERDLVVDAYSGCLPSASSIHPILPWFLS